MMDNPNDETEHFAKAYLFYRLRENEIWNLTKAPQILQDVKVVVTSRINFAQTARNISKASFAESCLR